MPVKLTDINIAKQSAKRLLKAFKLAKAHSKMLLTPITTTMKLSDAQEATAKMLGYPDWHNLHMATSNRIYHDNEVDEVMPEQVQIDRLHEQIKVLSSLIDCKETKLFGGNSGSEHVASEIVCIARVSAKNYQAQELVETYGTKCELRYIEQFGHWSFTESHRSSYLPYNDVYEMWRYGQMTNEDILNEAESMLKTAPESVGAIWLYFCAIIDSPEHIKEQESRVVYLHEEAMSWFPLDFDSVEDVAISWTDHDSRDFLRVVSMLGYALYVLKQYGRAKMWLDRLTRMTDRFSDYTQPVIDDLNKKKPTGRVRLEDTQ